MAVDTCDLCIITAYHMLSVAFRLVEQGTLFMAKVTLVAGGIQIAMYIVTDRACYAVLDVIQA